MSEQTGAPAEGAQTTETQTQGEPADKQLGPNGEKALAAEREARKTAEKSAADLQAQLDKIAQANLSDLEKAQKQAQETQTRLDALTRQNTVSTIALAKGVPADLVEFLTGTTEDEISAKADLLLSRLGAPKSPKPDASQGAKGGTPSAAQDQRAFARGLFSGD